MKGKGLEQPPRCGDPRPLEMKGVFTMDVEKVPKGESLFGLRYATWDTVTPPCFNEVIDISLSGSSLIFRFENGGTYRVLFRSIVKEVIDFHLKQK